MDERITRGELDKLAANIHKAVTEFMNETNHCVTPKVEVEFSQANQIGKQQWIAHVLVTAQMESAI